MANSDEIGEALRATLAADATLAALLPDGVWMEEAPQGSQKFAIVSPVNVVPEDLFGGATAYEDGLYMIKAVTLGTSATTAKAGARRIKALLHDQPLVNPSLSPAEVPGYDCAVHVEGVVVPSVEIDDVDPSIRWQHQGAYYRVEASVK